MKTKQVIALDVDGVLLDFYGAICKKYNMPLEMVDGKFDVDWIEEKFHEIADDGEFWSTMPQICPPQAITFDFDCYLTACPESMKMYRQINLKRHGFPNKPIIISHDKADKCLELGIDVLVDDKNTTILDCRNKGVNGIFIKPYYYPTNSFPEIENGVRSLHEASTQFENKY